MRLVFFGTPDVAVPALHAFVDAPDVDVVAVVTNPDRPRGRSRTPVAPPVKDAAVAAGIEVWQPERGPDVLDELGTAAPDVCAVVAYGSILPRAVLDVPTHGFVNLHFSLLPRWRGAAPVQHAIRAGDDVTGLTTFVLDEGMDTGPVLDRVEIPIHPGETTGDLLDRLAVAGAPVLVDSVRALVAGAVPTAQPTDGVTMAPRIDPRDVRIDFREPAAVVSALVRSASPRPGAHTTRAGDRFKLYDAVVAGGPADPVDTGEASAGEASAGDDPPAHDPMQALGAPGELLVADADGLVIACGSGAIRTTRVQPAGKPVMDAVDFVNGYQPDPGERFGADGGSP